MIQLENITKIYPGEENDIYALKEVSLTIERGEFVAIVGRSGSGKSTLMNILGCLDRPTTGTYSFCGQEVNRKSPKELALLRNQHIGFIFQSFHLISSMTALENVELPLAFRGVPPAKRRQLALEALESVDMRDRADHRPCQLSGGQQQRVAIARAIVPNPELILADEPTGNLDPASGERTMGILEQLHRGGSTVVLITHDRAVAQRAQRRLEIYNGLLNQTE
ncbi:ABC transporter ATP-binding protein [Acidaminobacterium chupaoyuni]